MQESWSLIYRILDIIHKNTDTIRSHSFLKAILGFPFKNGLDAASAIIGVLDNCTFLEAELLPVFLD